MNVPAAGDMTQTQEKLVIPEIRVWCHPHYIGEKGGDYYRLCSTFADAHKFIAEHREAEPFPVIAFDGYEFNIYKHGELIPVVVDDRIPNPNGIPIETSNDNDNRKKEITGLG